MQIICEALSLNFIKKNLANKSITGYIIGVETYSLDASCEMSINQMDLVIHYLKQKNYQVIINIARLFHEDELPQVEKFIERLNVELIDYFMYSDFGVYSLLEKHHLQTKTLLYSPTYLTNTFDVRLYQELNGAVILSNQINSEELVQIINNSKENKMILGFGRATIFYSRRPLLENYFKYRKYVKNPLNHGYTLREEYRDVHYPIIETPKYTKVIDYGHYYLMEEFAQINQEVPVILNASFLKVSQYQQVIDLYSKYFQKLIKVEDVIVGLKQVKCPLDKGAYEKELTLLKGDDNE